MSVTVDITETQLMTWLGNFLLAVLPTGVTVVQGQQNRVPMPNGDFVTMTTVVTPKLATSVSSWQAGSGNPGIEENQTSTRWDVQLDFYGPSAQQNSMIVSNLVRTDYTCRYFADNGYSIAPLYADEPRNGAMINAEKQYQSRWILQASFQFNPTITTPLDFAAELKVELVEVDTTYHGA
jgi:hypothetical protein